LQDYARALEYHKKDLELSEQFGDEPGRAKACGNVGNALQLLGDYDEAILYLLRNLDISKKLNDSVSCGSSFEIFLFPDRDSKVSLRSISNNLERFHVRF
jgi:tetratricopeptide (TPR) repeat protein